MSKALLADDFPARQRRAPGGNTESDKPVKRGPGRPRKAASCRPLEPAPEPALVDLGFLATDRRGVARITGKSISTIKRLEQSDPDWPVPFAFGGHANNNYFVSEVQQYMLKKQIDARAAKGVGSKRPATSAEKQAMAAGEKA